MRRLACVGTLLMAALLLTAGCEMSQADIARGQRLFHAAKNGSRANTWVALQGGASPNLRNQDGETPLHVAAASGHMNVVQELLMSGADPNIGDDRTKRTPLMYAVARSDQPMTQLLIEFGADVNAAEKDGTTPLIIAAKRGDRDMLNMLGEAGATKGLEQAQQIFLDSASR